MLVIQVSLRTSWMKRVIPCLMMLFLVGCATAHREPTKEVAAKPTVVDRSMVPLSQVASKYRFVQTQNGSSSKRLYRRGRNRVEIDPNSRVAYFDSKLVILAKTPQVDGEQVFVPSTIERNFAALTERVVAKTPKKKIIKSLPRGSLGGKHFVIDAGHGGIDPGAARNGVREKDITLTVALEVAKLLRQEGARVTLTRNSDRKIPLNRRAQISNETRPDAFVSIHVNAAKNTGARGVEVYAAANRTSGQRRDKLPKSARLAQSLFRHLSSVSPGGDRGVKRSPGFRVLKRNNHAAVLVELGFVSNRSERKLLASRRYQSRLAKAVVDGIRDFSVSI